MLTSQDETGNMEVPIRGAVGHKPAGRAAWSPARGGFAPDTFPAYCPHACGGGPIRAARPMLRLVCVFARGGGLWLPPFHCPHVRGGELIMSETKQKPATAEEQTSVRARLAAVVERIRSGVPEGIPDEEVEQDIAQAIAEVRCRQRKRARRR